MKKLTIGLITFSIVACLVLFQRSEFGRIESPNGQYIAVYTYRTFLESLFMPPGSSSDKPGYVEIFGKNNKSYGELPLPMLQLGAIDWQEDGASIQLIGEWNFKEDTLWRWSEDGNSKVQIK